MNAAVNSRRRAGFEGELQPNRQNIQIILGIIPTTIALCVAIWYFLHGQRDNFRSVYLGRTLSCRLRMLSTRGQRISVAKNFSASAPTLVFATFACFVYRRLWRFYYFTHNVIWVAFGNFFFGFLGNLIIYQHHRQKNPAERQNSNPVPVAYGNHLTAMSIPGTISSQLDALLVYHFVGPAALAVYTFATLLPEKFSGGIQFISNIALPKFSEKSKYR